MAIRLRHRRATLRFDACYQGLRGILGFADSDKRESEMTIVYQILMLERRTVNPFTIVPQYEDSHRL